MNKSYIIMRIVCKIIEIHEELDSHESYGQLAGGVIFVFLTTPETKTEFQS